MLINRPSRRSSLKAVLAPAQPSASQEAAAAARPGIRVLHPPPMSRDARGAG